jgi:hypothetical protein
VDDESDLDKAKSKMTDKEKFIINILETAPTIEGNAFPSINRIIIAYLMEICGMSYEESLLEFVGYMKLLSEQTGEYGKVEPSMDEEKLKKVSEVYDAAYKKVVIDPRGKLN